MDDAPNEFYLRSRNVLKRESHHKKLGIGNSGKQCIVPSFSQEICKVVNQII